MSPFQHKYGYIRDNRSRVESYPYPVQEGQRYINLNTGHLFIQQTQKGKGIEKLILTITLAPTKEETTITPQDKTKSNMTKTSMHPWIQNTHNTQSTKYQRLLRHPAWKRTATILVEWEEMEKMEKKQENRRSE